MIFLKQRYNICLTEATMKFAWDQRTWENQYFKYDLIPAKCSCIKGTRKHGLLLKPKNSVLTQDKLCIIGLLKRRWVERANIITKNGILRKKNTF